MTENELKNIYKQMLWIIPGMLFAIGYLLELLIPWQFNGFASGFESFGWILMFIGGRKLVMQTIQEFGEKGERS